MNAAQMGTEDKRPANASVFNGPRKSNKFGGANQAGGTQLSDENNKHGAESPGVVTGIESWDQSKFASGRVTEMSGCGQLSFRVNQVK